jgi:hypothetical protein
MFIHVENRDSYCHFSGAVIQKIEQSNSKEVMLFTSEWKEQYFENPIGSLHYRYQVAIQKSESEIEEGQDSENAHRDKSVMYNVE